MRFDSKAGCFQCALGPGTLVRNGRSQDRIRNCFAGECLLYSHVYRSVKTFSFRRFLCRVPQHGVGHSKQLHYLLAQDVPVALGSMYFVRPPSFQPWNISSLLALHLIKTLCSVMTVTEYLSETWIRISHYYSNILKHYIEKTTLITSCFLFSGQM